MDTLDRVSEGYHSDIEDTQTLRDHFLEDFEDFKDLLENGDVRAAEKRNGDWEANQQVKEGILLGFQLGEIIPFDGSYSDFQDMDTFPPREAPDEARMVPGGSSARSGAYIGDDVIMMPPMYINTGSYVGEGTMVDSHALVGSAAQVGEDVHLSMHSGLGGVLEPVNQAPVVVEDGVVLGDGASVTEGVVVRENAVLAPGTKISGSVEIYDTVEDEVYKGEVPEGAVVIPGSVEYGEVAGETVYKDAAIVAKYRDESTDADTALEEALR